MDNYTCQRCGYKATTLANLKTHYKRKTPCNAVDSNESASALLKSILDRKDYKYVCQFCQKRYTSRQGLYVHKKQTHLDIIITTKQEIDKQLEVAKNVEKESVIKQLQLDLMYYKNKKNESFYQAIVEEYLQGTHKKLTCGITDITTDDCHAEVKEWCCYKEAMGQLMAYNSCDPKSRLEIYLFGKYEEKSKNKASQIMHDTNHIVYEFVHIDNGVDIMRLNDKSIVYQYRVAESECAN